MAATMATRQRRVGVEVIDPSLVEAALKHTGMTQAALARELEVDQKTVNNLTSGRRPIYRLAWYAIALALKLPKDWEPPEAPELAPPDPE
jgi:plasmid maintenance system antidote protein VapI